MIALAAMRMSLRFCRRLRHAGRDFIGDHRAIAAIEFAFIVPLMLVLFFGTVDLSAGLAASRKVTLTASALADLASEVPANGNIAPVADTDLQNMFTAGISIMNPYLQNSSNPITATISEIYVDSSSNATFVWSRTATAAPGDTQASFVTSIHNPNDPVPTLPPSLLIPKTYVLFMEVKYQFLPMVAFGALGSAGVNLSDNAYSRPREAPCLVYNGMPNVTNGVCPTL
jgi:Flp pilus assembly protein TadG